jgi:hypothetical protein
MPSNTYILPNPGLGFARSACLTSFASGVSGVSGLGYLAAATYEVDRLDVEGIWTFDQINLTTLTNTSARYIDAATDGASGFYVLGVTGPLIHVSSLTAAPSSITLPTSPSFAYTGLTFNTANGKPYMIGYDGTIYTVTAGVVSTVAGPPGGGIVAPAKGLYSDSTSHLYTIFPTSNVLAKYTIGTGWTSTLSPFTASLDTLSYSTSIGAAMIAGRNTSQVTDSNTILDLTYTLNPTQVLIADTGPSVQVYTLTEGGFVFAQAVTGYSGIPTQLAAEPDGNQCLVTDSTNNRIEVLTYNGAWSQTSTVPLSGPTNLSIYTNPNGLVQALVCQPSNNTLSVMNKSVNTWAVIQTLNIPGATSVSIDNTQGVVTAIVTTATGVQLLSNNGAVWVLGNAIALNPVPTLSGADVWSTTNNQLYAAGSSGGNTTVYAFSGNTILGSYSFTGTMSGLEIVNWQALVATTTGNLNVGYYIGGTTGNVVNPAVIPAASSVNMAWIPATLEFYPTLVIAGPNIIQSFFNDSPQSFTRETDSSIAILISGGAFTSKTSAQFSFQPIRTNSAGVSGQWTTLDLINRNKVSSITSDANRNIYAVTVGNDIYKYNGSGTLITGYPYILTPPTNQEEFIPLGLSKLVFWNNQLWSASGLLGGLVEIIP